MSNVAAGAATESVVLSEEDKKRLAHRARRDLVRVLLAQVAASVLVAIGFLAFAGLDAGLSAGLGAACYLAPNAVFVLRLVLATFKSGGAGAATFLIGNGLKVLVVLGLLWLLADTQGVWLDWVAVIVGLIAALKGYWLGLLLTGGRLAK